MADWKKFAGSNVLDIGLSGIGVAVDISAGKGVVKSVGKGLIDYALYDTIGAIVGGPAMGVYMGAQLLGMAGTAVIENGKEKAKKVSRNAPGYGRVGGGFFDNEQSYTMRQRSLQAMGGHQGLVNNSLGSEARRRAANIRY